VKLKGCNVHHVMSVRWAKSEGIQPVTSRVGREEGRLFPPVLYTSCISNVKNMLYGDT